MKKDGKYRFSLQFGSDSDDQIRAGELLEKLGNKKSAVVVAALNMYMSNHPELKTNTLKITILEESAIRREKLEALIRRIVEDRLALVNSSGGTVVDIGSATEALGDDIAQMVSNLDFFN